MRKREKEKLLKNKYVNIDLIKSTINFINMSKLIIIIMIYR